MSCSISGSDGEAAGSRDIRVAILRLMIPPFCRCYAWAWVRIILLLVPQLSFTVLLYSDSFRPLWPRAWKTAGCIGAEASFASSTSVRFHFHDDTITFVLLFIVVFVMMNVSRQ
jgi:hypothetical protein